MAVTADLPRLLDEQHETGPPKVDASSASSLLTSADYCGLSGWYWYCEEHDAHGIADSEDEAEFVLDAHIEYHELNDGTRCSEDGTKVVFFDEAEIDLTDED